MTAPVIQVLVGFQTTTGFGTPFQLDDAVFGVLDTSTLGGLAFADLTEIVQSVNIKRGRNRQLDQFNSGTAQVAFWNEARLLDPLNTSSIFYPFVLPRCPIVILADGIPIYTGIVKDWNLDYSISNKDVMVASCADAFTVLANQQFDAFTPSAQSTSARINTVLDRPEISYQGARAIGTGSSTLGAYAVTEGQNVLNYLQLVNTSEQGYLYIAADGTLTFKGRTEVLNPVANATFNTDGTGLPYQSLINQFGDELLYNYISTQSPAGAVQIANNSTSISLYQAQQYSLLDLLNNSTTEVAGIANYLLGKYQNPILRFTGLSTELAALTQTQSDICLSLDLTDIATVTKTYAVGTPTTETQTLIVSGVEHRIRPGSHVISYTFESTDGNAYFTLDDAIFGVLDQNLLAF
jgi:hypothetical protein